MVYSTIFGMAIIHLSTLLAVFLLFTLPGNLESGMATHHKCKQFIIWGPFLSGDESL